MDYTAAVESAKRRRPAPGPVSNPNVDAQCARAVRRAAIAEMREANALPEEAVAFMRRKAAQERHAGQ